MRVEEFTMIGKTISHYRVIDMLGQGGMGQVFLAHDTILDRKVALEFLAESAQHDPNAGKRFLREAKSVLHDPPPQLRVQSAAVLPELARLLNKTLAKDISQRYQSVAEIAVDIKVLREKRVPKQDLHKARKIGSKPENRCRSRKSLVREWRFWTGLFSRPWIAARYQLLFAH